MSSHRPPPIRRSRFLGAGLLLLALWVQALAPVAALRVLSAAADPLRDAIICGHARDADSGLAGEQPAPSVPACGPCRLCCAGIATPTLPGVPPTAGRLRWDAVSWPMPPPAKPNRVNRYVGQPRAPPIPA